MSVCWFFNKWQPGKPIKRLEHIFRCILVSPYVAIWWKSTFFNVSNLEEAKQIMSWIIPSTYHRAIIPSNKGTHQWPHGLCFVLNFVLNLFCIHYFSLGVTIVCVHLQQELYIEDFWWWVVPSSIHWWNFLSHNLLQILLRAILEYLVFCNILPTKASWGLHLNFWWVITNKLCLCLLWQDCSLLQFVEQNLAFFLYSSSKVISWRS